MKLLTVILVLALLLTGCNWWDDCGADCDPKIDEAADDYFSKDADLMQHELQDNRYWESVEATQEYIERITQP